MVITEQALIRPELQLIEVKENLMKSRTRTWMIVVCLSAALAMPARSIAQNKHDNKPTFTTFDVPGGIDT